MNTTKFKNTFMAELSFWENDVENTIFAMVKNRQAFKAACSKKSIFNQA